MVEGNRYLELRLIKTYILSLIAFTLLTTIVITATPGLVEDERAFLAFSAFLNLGWYVLIAIGLVYIARGYIKGQLSTFDKDKRIVAKNIFGAFLLMFVANIAVGAFFMLIGHDRTAVNQEYLERLAESAPLVQASLFVFAVLLAPVVEELVFRKGAMGLLTRRFGIGAGVVLSSLIFALAHGMDEISRLFLGEYDQLLSLFPYFMLGLIIGYFYYRSGYRIMVAVGAHMLWNLVQVVLLFTTMGDI